MQLQSDGLRGQQLARSTIWTSCPTFPRKHPKESRQIPSQCAKALYVLMRAVAFRWWLPGPLLAAIPRFWVSQRLARFSWSIYSSSAEGCRTFVSAALLWMPDCIYWGPAAIYNSTHKERGSGLDCANPLCRRASSGVVESAVRCAA